jgi:hypothetical protein
VFSINLSASAANLMELASQPSLDLLNKAGLAVPKVSGQATAHIDLSLPLIKDVPRERVTSKAVVKIVDAGINDAMPNIDFTDGNVSIAFDRKGILASGSLKINGFPASVSWTRPAGANSTAAATLTTELDDKAREKLGIKLGNFIHGSAKLTADISGIGSKNATIQVKADLAKVEMNIDAINWSRPPTNGTTSSFSYKSGGDEGQKIEDLIVKGPDLSIQGDIFLNDNGSLKSAVLSQVWLNEENNFSMKMTPENGGQSIAINGNSFDARPFLKSIFSSSAGARSGEDVPTQNLEIAAQVDRVITHRGEVLTGLSANLSIKRSVLATAEIDGKFLSGMAIAIHVTPSGDGRNLQINSGDGGAVLRAANIYSKVAGGELGFSAQMTNDRNSTIQKGTLVLRDFAVRNEAALANVDSRGKTKKSGPRRDGLKFTKLKLPFTADARFIRIGSTLLKGNDLGASAEGIIRKSDGAIDITGTIIPAYGLNSAVSNIPLLGDILTGGRGQGIFGLAYAMSGTFEKPKFQVNPVSAIAPGITRKFFEFNGTGQPYKPKAKE